MSKLFSKLNLFVFGNMYYKFLINTTKNRLIKSCVMYTLVIGLSFFIGYKWRDGYLIYQQYHIEYLKNKENKLANKIDTLKSTIESYEFMLEDGDYYRYLAFKYSNIYIPKSVNGKDLKLMTEQAVLHKIPLKYYYRHIYKESCFNPNVVSKAGAKSYLQVMPDTFKKMKNRYGKDLSKYNAKQQNIIIGTYTLKYFYDIYKRWDLAFAAYNAGPLAVNNAGNKVPNITETINHVKFILNK